MPLRVVADAGALAEAAAGDLVEIGRAAIAGRGRFLLALSGGSTPRAMHARLTALPLRGGLDWSKVEFLWSDERSVPPDHQESNYRMARETLLDPLGIDPARIHRMEGEAPDLDAAARRYEQGLASLTGTPGGRTPVLDLVLLGMGPDGHTASLFPRTAALDARDRWVVSNQVPQLATTRLTFTFDLIETAREVRVLVAGAEKAPALAAAWNGAEDEHRLPAGRLAGERARATWIVDRAAAARLGPGAQR